MPANKRGLLPPAIFLMYLIIAPVLHFLFPVYQVLDFPWRWLGLIPAGIGAILNIWADSLFKRHRTTVKPYEKPSRLVEQGPFKVSRHPMYLGMAAILIGEAIFLGSLITILAPVGFIFSMEILYIGHEEKALREAFGEDYDNYRRRVRRWV